VWPAHRDVEVVEAEGDVSGVQGDCEAVVDGMVAGDVGGGEWRWKVNTGSV
jgi:hypothetical protein